MTNPVMVVRRQVRQSAFPPHNDMPEGRGLWVWCPGCDLAHRPMVVGEDGSQPPGPCWEWDGNLEAPTISPSILVRWTGTDDATEQPLDKVCHSFIRAGRWEFLGDSTHPLAGQTVPMVPVPDWLVTRRED